jgi:hypothetical protein
MIETFPKGVHDRLFRGGANILRESGEVENDLRGDAHLPTPPLQIWPCLIPIWTMSTNVVQMYYYFVLFCFPQQTNYIK